MGLLKSLKGKKRIHNRLRMPALKKVTALYLVIPRLLFFTISLLLIHHSAHGQEGLGLKWDNYSASSGMLLNPCAPQTAVPDYQINVLNYQVMAEWNDSLLETSSTSGFLCAGGQLFIWYLFHTPDHGLSANTCHCRRGKKIA